MRPQFRLAVAGRRAYWLLGDFNAAAGLLERTLTLTRPYRLDVHLEVELASALELVDGRSSRRGGRRRGCAC
jgi:hypothetical protein